MENDLSRKKLWTAKLIWATLRLAEMGHSSDSLTEWW